MKHRIPHSQRGEYSLLGNTSQTLYNAYKSNAGKVVQGTLEGALGATIAAMSSVADEEMLGIHTALGGIWTALTAKNFVEAGHEYLHKKEEDIENIGIEILTYAKLRSRNFEGEQNAFSKTINDELIAAISGSLVRKKSPEVSSDEIDEIVNMLEVPPEKFEALVRKRSEMQGGTMLTVAAVLGVAAVIGGVGTMVAAGSNTTAFNTGIGIAGGGTFLTSLSGGLMNASATNSRSISSGICEAIQSLNESKFIASDIEEVKTQVITEQDSVRKRRAEGLPSAAANNTTSVTQLQIGDVDLSRV